MLNHDWYWEMTELKKNVKAMKTVMDEVKAVVKPEEELWNSRDMIRYWKVSARTLADWRAKGLIGYTQVGNIIWYPREAREEFMQRFEVKPVNGGGRNDG